MGDKPNEKDGGGKKKELVMVVFYIFVGDFVDFLLRRNVVFVISFVFHFFLFQTGGYACLGYRVGVGGSVPLEQKD